MIVKTYGSSSGMIFGSQQLFKQNMQERFHALPMVKATSYCSKKDPTKEILIKDYKADHEIMDIDTERKASEIQARHIIDTAHTPIPEVCVLSNNFIQPL